jgi:hypothetical protein
LYFGERPTFRRRIPLPSSQWKNKPSKKFVEAELSFCPASAALLPDLAFHPENGVAM